MKWNYKTKIPGLYKEPRNVFEVERHFIKNDWGLGVVRYR